jgi:bifunctional non-homologous end joining protein LigD
LKVARPRCRAVFFAFDLVWLDHEDLRQVPLIERKKKLKKLIEHSECSEILYAQHVKENGKLLFEEVCDRNLEGIVAMRRIGVYAEHGWLKIRIRSTRRWRDDRTCSSRSNARAVRC